MFGILKGIGSALVGLLSSKKFWTAVGTCAVTAATSDPKLQATIGTVGTVLLGAQGAQDWGKAAKK